MPKPQNILISDKEFLVSHYRILLDILSAVKVGYVPRDELDSAIDSFIRFKLPKKFQTRISSSSAIDEKYRTPRIGELTVIGQRYQTDEQRNRESAKIENEIRFNIDLDILEEIKNLLEEEGIMNVFDTTRKSQAPAPVS